MHAQSIALAKKVKYFSAGTVEYIMGENEEFYFMEMNTRLQVEHPVTELVTGIDIVEQMIRIAQGEELKIKQEDVVIKGHAMECRVYAEDPLAGFLPSTGRINLYREPKAAPNLRIDSGIYEGGQVSMFYDAMISKVCVHTDTRAETIARMNEVLGHYIIEGVSHNISFLQTILSMPKFQADDISTQFIAEQFKAGFTGPTLNSESRSVVLCSSLFMFLHDQRRMHNAIDEYSQYPKSGVPTRWVVIIENERYPITVTIIENGYKISFENRRFYITSNWILGNKLFQCEINGKQYTLQAVFV
jgi:propionyl-CoA carboxylase alpha chain